MKELIGRQNVALFFQSEIEKGSLKTHNDIGNYFGRKNEEAFAATSTVASRQTTQPILKALPLAA